MLQITSRSFSKRPCRKFLGQKEISPLTRFSRLENWTSDLSTWIKAITFIGWFHGHESNTNISQRFSKWVCNPYHGGSPFESAILKLQTKIYGRSAHGCNFIDWHLVNQGYFTKSVPKRLIFAKSICSREKVWL